MNQNRDQKKLMVYFEGITKRFIRVGKRLIIKGSVVRVHLGPHCTENSRNNPLVK